MAITCVNEFLASIHDEDILYNAYPLAKNLSQYYKIDNFTILDINKLEDKKFSIKVKCSFTNGFGKTYNHTMTFYLRPIKDSSKYQIYDSKGFCANYNFDDQMYCFAVKTGCVNQYDKTDQEIYKKMKIAADIYVHENMSIFFDIDKKLKIKRWGWEYSYNIATGRGICVNSSQYYIYQPQYKIKYYDRKGNIITEDSGYITYDILPPGGSKSFSFYSGYIGNSERAQIEVIYNHEKTINNYILNIKEYTGNEYYEQLERNANYSKEIEENIINN